VPARFSIAQVTPYAWEDRHDVNAFVRATSEGLVARGHDVLVLAPSHSLDLVHASRQAIHAGDVRADGLRVLGVGEVFPLRSARRPSSVPVDVARTIEELLGSASLDFVHVHEPFAPSTAAAALRHSRSLNVGSFHAPTERLISTQVARRFVELFFGRLDARTAAWPATRELMSRHFPAPYELVPPAAEPIERDRRSRETVEIVFVAAEERAAQRLFLRALRRLPVEAPWRATLIADEWRTTPLVRRELADRIRFQAGEGREALAWADVVVFASAGVTPAPALLQSAVASHVAPVASRIPLYEDLLGDGERGLLFEPGDVEILTGQLTRLVEQPDLLERFATPGPARAWSEVVDELEDLYARVAARRHDTRANGAVRKRIASRPLIDVDLHMHTDHSGDCATPVEALLAEAKAKGLGAIAITDHNEISGALEAREKADGIKVIVSEEVKTADQGEVIGLFIEEKIPRGMTLQETIAEIKRQGGLVYVPHPFDRLHAVPDYPHLLDVLDDVDAIEIFNPRVAISSFNEEAVRFAEKYRVVCGAGSDAHVTAGLGSVRIRMRSFDTPEEFLESLRDADIIRNPASLVYVQALKFLQTKATPTSARRAAKVRRIRRAERRAARKS
jgi:predicted metal-dependent phosphoesterase TrpH/glycosyltransferase involved in cell wall biosynthesis